MKSKLAIPSAALLALALAAPAFAGGGQCGNKTSATATGAGHGSCSSARSTAWAGAWLERSSSGQIVVADVAAGSPAARSGLRAGDVVLAVNGRDLRAAAKEGHLCADGTSCNVGSSFAYRIQRGNSTRTLRLKLESMPASATERFANREASFDPALAALVIPSRD